MARGWGRVQYWRRRKKILKVWTMILMKTRMSKLAVCAHSSRIIGIIQAVHSNKRKGQKQPQLRTPYRFLMKNRLNMMRKTSTRILQAVRLKRGSWDLQLASPDSNSNRQLIFPLHLYRRNQPWRKLRKSLRSEYHIPCQSSSILSKYLCPWYPPSHLGPYPPCHIKSYRKCLKPSWNSCYVSNSN